MMQPYFKILFIISISILILTACKDPASTQELTDPKSLRPIITLDRSLNNETGVVTSITQVTLKNVKNESVEIEGGKILINGHEMEEPGGLFFWEFTDYYQSSLPLELDTVYTFQIFFSDGDYYEAWIETPEIDLNHMELPLKKQRNTNLTVKWTETDYRYPQFLLVQYYQPSIGFNSKSQDKIALRYPYLGSFTVDKKYIKYTDKASEAIRETRIVLVAQTLGALDKNFQPGGSITCNFNIYQDIEIY